MKYRCIACGVTTLGLPPLGDWHWVPALGEYQGRCHNCTPTVGEVFAKAFTQDLTGAETAMLRKAARTAKGTLLDFYFGEILAPKVRVTATEWEIQEMFEELPG